MSIPTIASLRRARGRLDQRRLWWLTDGRAVSPEIAKLVIVDADVGSVGDALFQDMPTQTFRFIE
jgi:hypothetical protein